MRPLGAHGREAPEDEDDSSGESTSEEEDAQASTRQRALQRRGRARAKQLLDLAERRPAEAARLSALELRSVSRKTLETYTASVREFCSWSGLCATEEEDPPRLYEQLVGYMNHQLQQGHRA